MSRLAARSRLDLPVGRKSGVPDVDASPVEVVLERRRFAAPDAERRGGLVCVGEAVEFSEADRRPQSRALLGQVAEDAARGDRGQLLVVSDQADAAASLEYMVDDGGEVLGSHHRGLVDDDEGPWADGREGHDPAVALGGRGAVEELGDGLSGGVGRLAELVCCDCGGCEPDDLPAATTPGLREGGHRGGLAAARRSEGDLDAGPTGGEGADKLGLTGGEGQARRGGPPDGEVDEEVGYGVPVDPFPGLEEAPLGFQDRR